MNKKLPRVCKNCEYRTREDKCPHLRRLGGCLPDSGRCKSYKKKVLPEAVK
ncbi:MAG: hypothetical protein Pg6C_18040 [Treponemataceae bacterium]|nr:MAG: hypothetical protein Pg6C_18040 [Treponemataceae bacterium]